MEKWSSGWSLIALKHKEMEGGSIQHHRPPTDARTTEWPVEQPWQPDIPLDGERHHPRPVSPYWLPPTWGCLENNKALASRGRTLRGVHEEMEELPMHGESQTMEHIMRYSHAPQCTGDNLDQPNATAFACTSHWKEVMDGYEEGEEVTCLGPVA
ncbi:hypothetical protein KUCAC02_008048 [Chaenocephalus aceratus]|uniref:Uncharacterized protein n=1 Tax=Chaenocephalus aceratus TaxID=36190 RepID=A0ACB9X8X8_CHAAC|nr:hypothetical protein KUCAC02_008048 [Chaenocephalus aceratus]